MRASDLVETVRSSEIECACDCDRFREGRRGSDIDLSVASPPPPLLLPPTPPAAPEPGAVGTFTRGVAVRLPKTARSVKKSMLPPPPWPMPVLLAVLNDLHRPPAHALVLERSHGLHLPRAALALEVIARLEYPAFAKNNKKITQHLCATPTEQRDDADDDNTKQEGTHFANEGIGDGSAKSSCAKLRGRPPAPPASPLLANAGDSSPLPARAPGSPRPRPSTRDGPATAPAPPTAPTTGATLAAHDSDDDGVARFTAERDLGSCSWCRGDGEVAVAGSRGRRRGRGHRRRQVRARARARGVVCYQLLL